VSKLQRHRCHTFGALRPRNRRGQTGRYIFIYIDVEESRQPLWSSGQSSFLQNGDVLCFLWGTNWIYSYVCYVGESRPPLWPRGQISWLQMQRSGFDPRHCQIFWELVGLERGPLNLVSTIEELPGRRNSCSGLEILEYGRRDPSRWTRNTLHQQKMTLTFLTRGGRSVGIVRSQTKATSLLLYKKWNGNWHNRILFLLIEVSTKFLFLLPPPLLNCKPSLKL
jgi:hypothetical protein